MTTNVFKFVLLKACSLIPALSNHRKFLVCLEICVLNLRYARTGHAKNVKNAKGMPFPMYNIYMAFSI